MDWLKLTDEVTDGLGYESAYILVDGEQIMAVVHTAPYAPGVIATLPYQWRVAHGLGQDGPSVHQTVGEAMGWVEAVIADMILCGSTGSTTSWVSTITRSVGSATPYRKHP